MKTLLIIPPLVQINTPYPATSFLTGFLRSRGLEANQTDLGLALVLELFSAAGLEKIALYLKQSTSQGERELEQRHPMIPFFLENFSDYHRTIDPMIRFLQGQDPSLAHRISSRTLLPEGPRFQTLDEDDLKWSFGALGVQDQAKHLASLYLDDLVDLIQQGIDSRFSLSRYGDKLAASQPDFTPLYRAVNESGGLIEEVLIPLVHAAIDKHSPDLVVITVPFPGCMLGTLKIAKIVRAKNPKIKVAIGGGYVNTELRSLKDARLFEWVDALTLDDGERPLECLIEYLNQKRPREKLLRTFLLSEKIKNTLEFCSDPSEHDIPQLHTGFPTLDGLEIHRYISMVEMLNPMHRFWSDLHWNKLMLAHGCYWHKCSFCDVNLDYIKRYEASPAALTVERMKRLAQESNSSGFHFVDEAAPPALLKELSTLLIAQKLSYSWWGNIRFEKTFTPELTELMSDAGCVAVSGGLEVASDRLLKKMQKGVTVEQVARVTHSFRKARILVHAYLMYGFPTETLQETIDSLERVRQLFENGCLNSAFWHRFSATAHSPVGHDPEGFGIKIMRDQNVQFAENDLAFVDPVVELEKMDLDRLGYGLKKAVYNYMLGIGIERDVRTWFEFKVPKAKVDPLLILRAIENK